MKKVAIWLQCGVMFVLLVGLATLAQADSEHETPEQKFHALMNQILEGKTEKNFEVGGHKLRLRKNNVSSHVLFVEEGFGVGLTPSGSSWYLYNAWPTWHARQEIEGDRDRTMAVLVLTMLVRDQYPKDFLTELDAWIAERRQGQENSQSNIWPGIKKK